jgi:hypothetical protein
VPRPLYREALLMLERAKRHGPSAPGRLQSSACEPSGRGAGSLAAHHEHSAISKTAGDCPPGRGVSLASHHGAVPAGGLPQDLPWLSRRD